MKDAPVEKNSHESIPHGLKGLPPKDSAFTAQTLVVFSAVFLFVLGCLAIIIWWKGRTRKPMAVSELTPKEKLTLEFNQFLSDCQNILNIPGSHRDFASKTSLLVRRMFGHHLDKNCEDFTTDEFIQSLLASPPSTGGIQVHDISSVLRATDQVTFADVVLTSDQLNLWKSSVEQWWKCLNAPTSEVTHGTR